MGIYARQLSSALLILILGITTFVVSGKVLAKSESKQASLLPEHSQNYSRTHRAADAIEAAHIPGVVGILLQHENKIIDIYVYGTLNPKINMLQNTFPDVDFRINQALHSKDQLRKASSAISALIESNEIPESIEVTSIYVLHDGSGIELQISEKSATPSDSWLGNLEKMTGNVTLYLNAERFDLEATSGRAQDSSPWSGGSFYQTYPDSGYPDVCSTGLGVASRTTSVKYLLTARHCFSNSSSQPIEVYGSTTYLGKWSSSDY